MTLIISTISLGVVVPTLKENNLGKTAIGQIILLVAVIADLVTMILLAVFVGLNSAAKRCGFFFFYSALVLLFTSLQNVLKTFHT